MENKWISLDKQPPNKRILVRDDLGNIGYAEPTYYSWKMIEGLIVWLKEEYWDGGFLCECIGIDTIINGNITHWQPLPEPPIK